MRFLRQLWWIWWLAVFDYRYFPLPIWWFEIEIKIWQACLLLHAYSREGEVKGNYYALIGTREVFQFCWYWAERVNRFLMQMEARMFTFNAWLNSCFAILSNKKFVCTSRRVGWRKKLTRKKKPETQNKTATMIAYLFFLIARPAKPQWFEWCVLIEPIDMASFLLPCVSECLCVRKRPWCL